MHAVSIIGTGYVGLSTAVCFASRGYRVIASTHDNAKASMINAKQPPFYEPGLSDTLAQAIESGTLRAVSNREEAVIETDVTFLSVGTPERPDGDIDLQYVVQASKDIGRALAQKDTYHLVVVKSTVTPGTTRDVVKPLIEQASGRTAGVDFGLCMSPEFLRQGTSLKDTMCPDRVVIGEYDERSGAQLEALFAAFYGDSVPLLRMSLESAEMVTYASNAFLAAKISYANEIAQICETVSGVDVTHVMKGVGLDPRINPCFLNAGAGFGGSCLPKDVKALRAFAASHGYTTPLLHAVLAVNDAQAQHVAARVLSLLKDPRGKKVAMLGLAFKPDTDDVREAPSLKIARALTHAGTHVSAFDPVVPCSRLTENGTEALECADSIDSCLDGAHCCVVVTEWEAFKALTPDDFIEHMAEPVVVDARRVFDPEQFRDRLTFIAIGLGDAPSASSPRT